MICWVTNILQLITKCIQVPQCNKIYPDLYSPRTLTMHLPLSSILQSDFYLTITPFSHTYMYIPCRQYMKSHNTWGKLFILCVSLECLPIKINVDQVQGVLCTLCVVKRNWDWVSVFSLDFVSTKGTIKLTINSYGNT